MISRSSLISMLLLRFRPEILGPTVLEVIGLLFDIFLFGYFYEWISIELS
jgi:hypothetical protein